MHKRKAHSVIDADVHLHELDADLAPHLELPWRRALEGAPADHNAGERLFDVAGQTPYTPYDPILGDLPETPHQITSRTILLADIAARGVDAVVLYPGRLLPAAQVNDPAYTAALARAYNRYLEAQWLAPEQGVYAAIMVANQDPAAGAAEIRRWAGRSGVVAIYLPTAGANPLWGDRRYWPILEAAEEAALPVVLQGETTLATSFPFQLHHLPTALAKQALSQPLGALANLTSLFVSGTLARFPRLRVVVNDAGLAWLPFLLDRLDHFAPYLREEVPFLSGAPSDWLRERLYLTTHPLPGDPALAAALCHQVGVERLLFGSDWPHFDAEAADALRALPLTAAEQARLLAGNAQALFGITLPSPVAGAAPGRPSRDLAPR